MASNDRENKIAAEGRGDGQDVGSTDTASKSLLPGYKPHVTKTTANATLPSTSVVTQSPACLSQTSQHSDEKQIQLHTSDGRQVMLNVDKDMTFTELQKLIYEAVQVPGERQKISIGFPPTLLVAEDFEKKIVPLSHGDTITLEILPNVKSAGMKGDVEESGHAKEGRRLSWSSFEEDVPTQNAEKLLEALREVHHGGDIIDTSITSLSIYSAVLGKDFWTYVQGMPHLFSVGGLLYNQVQRDLGLVDGKHCQLPCLPGKVFCYHAQEDRLELCLEPYGHFPVEPHIEQRIKDMGIEGAQDGDEFGMSGTPCHNQGQGHIFTTSDIRMPGDLEYRAHRPHVRGIHDLCRGRSESISEETDEAHLDVSESANCQSLEPGSSVLDEASRSNKNSTDMEIIKTLTTRIEKTLSGNEIEEDKDDVSISSATDSMFTNTSSTSDVAKIQFKGDLNVDNTAKNAAGESVEKITDPLVEQLTNVDKSKNQNDDTEMEISS